MSLIPSKYKSYTGINFATGIILEKIIEKDLLKFYDVYLFNVKTLLRNLINLLPGRASDKIRFLRLESNLLKIIDELLSEVEIINENLKDGKVIFYFNNYKPLFKKLDNVRKISDFKGFKQESMIAIETMAKILTDEKLFPILNTTLYLPKPDMRGQKTLLTTHVGIDLLNYQYHPDTHLIESYTGEIKKYNKWYTKMHKIGKKDMSIIPFNEILYYIMGDDLYIRPRELELREWIYEVALNKRWNYNTKLTKIKDDLRSSDLSRYNAIITKIPRVYM